MSIMQIDLYVDGDSPVAWFYGRDRRGKYKKRRYRCPIYTTAARKRRFIDRVQAVQKALCRTVEEPPPSECECDYGRTGDFSTKHADNCPFWIPF